MRHHQRIIYRTIVAVTAMRRPKLEHPIDSALDDFRNRRAVLTFGISVVRREPIVIPAREFLGKALTDLIRSEALEDSEMHFGKIVDDIERRRIAGEDASAYGCANQRTRKNASERYALAE